jgi:hypothetical protein
LGAEDRGGDGTEQAESMKHGNSLPLVGGRRSGILAARTGFGYTAR